MLHVTNGQSAAHGIREAGLAGDVLCWNDVLHEGPVPPGPDAATVRETRARFIAGAGWARLEDARAELAARDARLEGARDEDEVVLWFEHDLYDQLQLVDVLTRLLPRTWRPRRVAQVATNRHLGTLHADWFRSEFLYREPVPEAVFDEAARVWRAFTAREPASLDALRPTLVELPFLGAAVARHLQEFPSMSTGLSRTEGQILDAISDGPHDLLATFHAAHHDREEAVFLGDIVFAWHVSRLSAGPRPLVTRIDGLPVTMPAGPAAQYWEQRVIPTRLAERILSGEVDRVAVAGVDRWLGGVHLEGQAVRWRWDERRQRIVDTLPEPADLT
jgi:hypothetical protein